jgi:cytochrome c oxidase cbb3-type subunit 3
VVLASVVLAAVSACDREERDFNEAPESSTRYDNNAYAISQGKVLFSAMNCTGCHAQGGGGIGPAFLDEASRYGSEPERIYESIAKGRPNGMPAWEARLTPQQTWQIVAYVRSLGSFTQKSARSARDDHMKVSPNLMLRDRDDPADTSR